jgi:hypothetical protein
MNHPKTVVGITAAILILAGAPASYAAPVSWTDWTSELNGSVLGSLTAGSDNVNVTFSGSFRGRHAAAAKNLTPSTPLPAGRGERGRSGPEQDQA